MSDNNKYNLTMLLPKTDFGMRGKLPTEEVKTEVDDVDKSKKFDINKVIELIFT